MLPELVLEVASVLDELGQGSSWPAERGHQVVDEGGLALCGLSRTTSRKLGRRWPPVPRAPLSRSMRPASCSSAAPSVTNTSVTVAMRFAKLVSLFAGRAGVYIPGCGRRLVAIARMPRSTDMARSSAPEIFLPSATRSMPEARSRDGPHATYRVNSSGPRVEASCARLTQTALARKARSFSRWASYKHHAKLVVFLR